MPMKGQPIKSIKYPRYSLEASIRRRESARVKVAKWRKENPEKYREQRLAWQRKNREKIYAKHKEHYRNNRERYRAYSYKSNLKTQFGITLEQYNSLWEAQGSKCVICKRSPSEVSGRFHVDHDHKTGHIRGIICPQCNHAIGLFRDDISVLKNAIKYMKRG
jgi:hypothetical protein